MKFSVCVAVYNGEDFLARALDSIQAQTYKDYELIVLDDGSTDASSEIAKRYNCRLLVQNPNQGVGMARKRMLEEAKGDWIAFLDHDDVWDPHFLELLAPLLDEPNVVQAYADAYLVAPDDKIIDYPLAPPLGDEAIGHVITQRIWNSASVIHRKTVLDLGSFSPELRACEDMRVWFLLSTRGEIRHLHEKLVRKMQRPGSASAPTLKYYQAEEAVVSDVLARFDELYPSMPQDRANFYKAKIKQKLGLILSLQADALRSTGDKKGSREMHWRALRLAPDVKGVWYRWMRNLIRV